MSKENPKLLYDDYINKNAKITLENEVFHFEIKEEGENDKYAKEK